MDERLHFTIDVPAALREHPFPPMMVITLVENAIKHGIHRSPSGGGIIVRARRNGERLTVEVADTGVGFRGSSGKGVGLANVARRLANFYGSAAGLSVTQGEGRFTVELRLPIELAL